MKKLFLILILFSIFCTQADAIMFVRGGGGGQGFSFDAADAVYVICTNAYWSSNSTTYGAANVDGNYETIGGWITGRSGTDGATQNSIAIIHGTATDSTGISIGTGWTDKNAGYYIIIRNDPILGTMHDGTYDGSGADEIVLSNSANEGFDFREPNIKIQNLKISHTGTSTSALIYYAVAAGTVYIENNLIVRTNSATSGSILYFLAGGATDFFISNNMMVIEYSSSNYAFQVEDADNTVYAYGNSIYAPSSRGVDCGAGTFSFRNNIMITATDLGYLGCQSSADYEATNLADESTNAPTGANCVHSVTAANIFNDLTADQWDLNLNSGGSEYGNIDNEGWPSLDDNGNYNVTTDYKGTARDGSTPTIGADEE